MIMLSINGNDMHERSWFGFFASFDDDECLFFVRTNAYTCLIRNKYAYSPRDDIS